MSTSKTYQQSLADAGSKTRPPMLERGSYIPWASRFRRFLNRNRENRKWLLKALEEGPYVFKTITRTGSPVPVTQEVEDLARDDLLYYDAEMELMNMILLSIPNEIYNYVDSCKLAKEMWERVERLMRETIQNQVDRETRFTNDFDQFVAEPGESLVSVYNRFAQLMNDLERNKMKFPIVSVNTKFLNSLQPEWLKYVTQVHINEEISLTIDEPKLKKMADEMLQQRCTLGDEHQYHIYQMKNFLQSDIVWESRKEILVSTHPPKIKPIVQSCRRDPEAPLLSLINQDLLYLKKGNSGPEKIVLSLHKFPAIIFNDDDIEE
ncbi:hypothetical protein Tco_0852724 [Tanacetum coccineum]